MRPRRTDRQLSVAGNPPQKRFLLETEKAATTTQCLYTGPDQPRRSPAPLIPVAAPTTPANSKPLIGGKATGLRKIEIHFKNNPIPRVITLPHTTLSTEFHQQLLKLKLTSAQLKTIFTADELNLIKSYITQASVTLQALAKIPEGIEGETERNKLSTLIVKLISSKTFCSEALTRCSELKLELEKCLNKFSNQTLAIRSSGVLEDRQDDSAAGLFSSKIGVKCNTPDQLMKELLAVISSNYSPKAYAHRAQHNQTLKSSLMAIIIQQIVIPAFSGVGFSCDPTSADPKLTQRFEMYPGFGEGMINSYGIPASISYSNDDTGKRIYEYVNGRAPQIVESYAKVKTLHGKEQDIDANDLAKNYGERLQEIAKKLENSYGRPVEFEFAITNDGKIAILQCRPIEPTISLRFPKRVELEAISKVQSYHTGSTTQIGQVFSHGLSEGPLVYIEDPNNITSFAELPPNAIVLVTQFTDALEAHIHNIKGYIAIHGGKLDHGSIVLRHNNITGIQASQALFDELKTKCKLKPNPTVTLVSGRFAEKEDAFLHFGAHKKAYNKQAIRTGGLRKKQLPIETIKKMEGIVGSYPLTTYKGLGKHISLMVTLNELLLSTIDPMTGGTIGTLIQLNPFDYVTQSDKEQEQFISNLKIDLGYFTSALEKFTRYYTALCNDSTEEKNEINKQVATFKETTGKLLQRLNPKTNFREKIQAISDFKKHLFEINDENSAHALIAKMHEEMYIKLQDIVTKIGKTSVGDISSSRCIQINDPKLFEKETQLKVTTQQQIATKEDLENFEYFCENLKDLEKKQMKNPQPSLRQVNEILSLLNACLKTKNNVILPYIFCYSPKLITRRRYGTIYNLHTQPINELKWHRYAVRAISQMSILGYFGFASPVCIISEHQVQANIGMGVHSVEISMRNDKINADSSLSIRYSEGGGRESCLEGSLLRFIYVTQIIKNLFPNHLKDLKIEKASNGIRVTIAPLDFENLQSKENGAIQVLKLILRTLNITQEGSDFALYNFVEEHEKNETPEISELMNYFESKSIVDILQGEVKRFICLFAKVSANLCRSVQENDSSPRNPPFRPCIKMDKILSLLNPNAKTSLEGSDLILLKRTDVFLRKYNMAKAYGNNNSQTFLRKTLADIRKIAGANYPIPKKILSLNLQLAVAYTNFASVFGSDSDLTDDEMFDFLQKDSNLGDLPPNRDKNDHYKLGNS